MTDESSRQVQRWRTVAPAYLATSLVFGMLLAQILIREDDLWMRSLAVALVGLVLWRASSILLLIAVQVYLVATETSGGDPGPWLSSASIAALSIAVFVLVGRYHMGRRMAAAGDSLDDGGPSFWSWTQMASPAIWSLVTVLVSVAVGWAILWWIPEDSMPGAWFRLRTTELRAIVLAFVLFAIFLIVSAVSAEVTWRQSSPQQARIYLRSSLVQWLERDLRMVARGRRRRRRLQSAANGRRESE